MGPIAYSLCQKPVIGIAMWITSLCAFPPLFSHEPLSLTVSGAKMIKEFEAPVDKSYAFQLDFEFPSVEARLKDQIVGSRYDENCVGTVKYQDIPEPQRIGLGRPIPFNVVIRRKIDRTVVTERTFNSLCLVSHMNQQKSRFIGWVELSRGDYIAEVTNLETQGGLESVKTYLSLVSGNGK